MSTRAQRRALKRLYDQIPTFECVPGCVDCCGPVPVVKAEGERAPKLVGFVESLHVGDCLTCPYAMNGCTIYEDRPFMCRLFGAVPADPRLRCPHGCKPEKPLTMPQAHKLTTDYIAIRDAWA